MEHEPHTPSPDEPADEPEPRSPMPIRNLIGDALDEIEQREQAAKDRDSALRTAFDHLSELRRAAARDHRFDDEFQEAIDHIYTLLQAERDALNPNPPERSPDA